MGQQNTQGREPKKYRKESDYDKRPVEKAMSDLVKQYTPIAERNGLSCDEEYAHVWALLTSNLSLLEQAVKAPQELTRALMQQASSGLTLEPSRQLCYLVIRRAKLIFDVGYRGLIRLAVDEGLITDAKAVLVYAKDKFTYRGPSTSPIIECDGNVFGDRGAIVGGYVEANLANGRVAIELMKESEFIDIAKLNPTSDAWDREFSSGEMRKKTMIKRAAKWWYNSAAGTDAGKRLHSTIHYLNTEAGEGDGIVNRTEAGETATEEIHYDPKDASKEAREYIAKVIQRAMPAKSWSAAADYLKGRYQGADLAYAKRALNIAKLIDRAQATGEWAAAETYCNEHYQGDDLAYAMKALTAARPQTTPTEKAA